VVSRVVDRIRICGGSVQPGSFVQPCTYSIQRSVQPGDSREVLHYVVTSGHLPQRSLHLVQCTVGSVTAMVNAVCLAQGLCSAGDVFTMHAGSGCTVKSLAEFECIRQHNLSGCF
jgi:hypothetical protein